MYHLLSIRVLNYMFVFIIEHTRKKREMDQCLRRAAMRKVMAGTEFCMEEANVGEV